MTIKTEHLSPTSLRLSCHFAASPERVFEAWTNPQQIAKWFHPEENVYCHEAQTDPQLGGKFRITLTTTNGPISAFGEYTVFDLPNQLQMTWQWTHEGPEVFISRLNLDMTPNGKGTDFVMTHDRFVDEEARDNHQHGWTGCLNFLITYFKNNQDQEN